VSLPFLKKNKLPRIAGPMGESRYGFSEDDEMSEDAIKELMEAIESKDKSKLMKALSALVEVIRNKNADTDV
jgi:hypothetical protein